MSFVPRCAGFSLTVTLTGRKLTLNLRIKVKWEQRMLIFYVLLHCILFYLILIFLLCFLYQTLEVFPISSSSRTTHLSFL